MQSKIQHINQVHKYVAFVHILTRRHQEQFRFVRLNEASKLLHFVWTQSGWNCFATLRHNPRYRIAFILLVEDEVDSNFQYPMQR